MSKDENSNLINRIIGTKDTLPKKQRYLCDYILKHYQSLGLVTVKELSDQAGVGVSTVMRVLDALGYDTFNDFRKDIYTESVPSKWTLKNSLIHSGDTSEESNTLADVLEENIELLNNTLDQELSEQFTLAVDMILESDFINIIGTRPYRATAVYLEQLLGEFFSNIRQLSQDIDLLYDKVLQFKKGDILIVFAFEPYTQLVVDAAKIAHGQGNKIILVTDYISCPVTPLASAVLRLPVSTEQFSIVPIISLIDAVVIEIGKRSSEESIEKLKRLETVLREHNIIHDK
ncbi:MurR/RpiR family transcriptional regulator [Corticicoccus populi]|uniref:MurR/RpiR family transcriptional regulator n=1 Tax=Corticicoccus populi TaxID=1812821 RepID=A0ABW5WX16_9STAP